MSQLKQQIEAWVQRKIDGVIEEIRQLQEVALASIEQKAKTITNELIQQLEAKKSYIDRIGISATDAARKAERAAKHAVEAAETVQEFASAVAKINSLETRLKEVENQIAGEK